MSVFQIVHVTFRSGCVCRRHEDVLAGAPGEPAAAEPGPAARQRRRVRAGMGAERGRRARYRRAQRGRHATTVGRGPDAHVLAGHVPGGGPALRVPFAGPAALPRSVSPLTRATSNSSFLHAPVTPTTRGRGMGRTVSGPRRRRRVRKKLINGVFNNEPSMQRTCVENISVRFYDTRQ